MTAHTDIRLIPLDQLYLHPFNPRQDVPDDDIEAMATSIAINGLMQNLSGYADPTSDKIGIVAGGRRWRGLVKLAAEGWNRFPDMARIDPVPVQVTSDHMMARSWALAENVTHRDLHPADEVRAYRAMIDQGNDAGMIARAFARTEAHVKRRLSLAALPDRALDQLKVGKISLDAAKAMTLANDQARLSDVLDAIDAGQNVTPRDIRNALHPKSIPATDRRAVFVGIDTYRAEGGALTEDLFEDTALLHNEELLDKLFATKLGLEAERVKAEEGWHRVVAIKDSWVPYNLQNGMTRLYCDHIELPEADTEELGELEDLGWDGRSEEGQARYKELRERQRGDFSDEAREIGTVFLYVRSNGELELDRAWAPAKQASKAAAATKSGGGEKPSLPANAVEDLRRIQTLAMQSAMVSKTELLLDILAWQIESGAPNYRTPLQVAFSHPVIAPEKDSSLHIDQRLIDAETADHTTEFSIDALEAFQAKGKKHRNATLAAGLARSLAGPAINSTARALMQIVTPEIRKHWTPDADNYFGRLRADLLDGIWAELLELDDDDRRAEFAKLKRKEKAAELEALFSDASVQEAHGLSRDQVAKIDAWLPEEME